MTSSAKEEPENPGPVPEKTTETDDRLIADASDLERFASDGNSEITPEIRGVVAETALTGLVRYPWPLLKPILHRLLDTALDSFSSDLAADEAGPPRPMPYYGTLDEARTALHSLLDSFSGPPFTFQRICEVLLEPLKQYNRVEKLVLALERLLLVTSTVEVTSEPPERPTLGSLGPINVNRPSPYDGEPPAGPPPAIEERLTPLSNGMIDNDDYAIFVGAEAGPSSPNPELVGSGVVERPVAIGVAAQQQPPPMEPAEVIQAEAFVEAALATPPEIQEQQQRKQDGAVGQPEESAAAAVEQQTNTTVPAAAEHDAPSSEADVQAVNENKNEASEEHQTKKQRQETQSGGAVQPQQQESNLDKATGSAPVLEEQKIIAAAAMEEDVGPAIPVVAPAAAAVPSPAAAPPPSAPTGPQTQGDDINEDDSYDVMDVEEGKKQPQAQTQQPQQPEPMETRPSEGEAAPMES